MGYLSGLRDAIEAGANVISKSETIAPNAGGFAKVDLQVEIHLPDKAPNQISTRCLVEVDSQDQVLPGMSVPVKVDQKKATAYFSKCSLGKAQDFWELIYINRQIPIPARREHSLSYHPQPQMVFYRLENR